MSTDPMFREWLLTEHHISRAYMITTTRERGAGHSHNDNIRHCAATDHQPAQIRESTMYREVLTFWFEEIEPKQWWVVEPALDTLIESRFGELLQRAARCELHEWRSQPKGRLAEIIVLDQFSRNVFRNTPLAFAQDPMALALAQEAVAAGVHRSLSPVECCFLLMPYMHSESARIHVEAEALFRQFAPDDNYRFELQHKAIVDRFKRYPHRNAILGRASTPEEIEFLKQPGSGF